MSLLRAVEAVRQISGPNDLAHFILARPGIFLYLNKLISVMKILNLSIGTMIFRLHAMCALMVTLGFLGLMYVGIVAGMILFLATLMGIQWKHINPFRHIPHPNDLEWEKRHHHHHAAH